MVSNFLNLLLLEGSIWDFYTRNSVLNFKFNLNLNLHFRIHLRYILRYILDFNIFWTYISCWKSVQVNI